ncbi:MAG: hypothetical protein KO463_01410 [Candidatus Methanofastidiosa archaeon]|nr:hypothetical protein [Candidatus Methanofastidiosa archaeon]
MRGWVQRTQGAPWGTGAKSGYGQWIRGIESTHGNSLFSQRPAYLYRLEDPDGNLLKWGITQDMNARYSQSFLYNKKMLEVTSGRRSVMSALERNLVRTQPGPFNLEPWAGAGK